VKLKNTGAPLPEYYIETFKEKIKTQKRKKKLCKKSRKRDKCLTNKNLVIEK
jgi:hypothetical protein